MSSYKDEIETDKYYYSFEIRTVKPDVWFEAIYWGQVQIHHRIKRTWFYDGDVTYSFKRLTHKTEKAYTLDRLKKKLVKAAYELEGEYMKEAKYGTIYEAEGLSLDELVKSINAVTEESDN